jgi:hypothetical protein
VRYVVSLLTSWIFSWMLLPSPVHGESTLDVDLTGRLAERFTGGSPTEKGAELHGKYSWLGEQVEVHAEGRARWNEAYADTSRYSEAARDAYRFSADIRELFASTQQGDWQLSAGWQQVVWGRADNLRILDQVNPLDFRELVLPDLNEYRRALFMLRALGQVGDWSVEALYIPVHMKNRLAVYNSEFYIPTTEAFEEQGFGIRREKRPGGVFENAEIGVNVSRTFGSTDINFIAFHTRDDDPVYRLFSPEETGGNPELQPEYHRQLQLGVGIAHNLEGGYVLRSELSFLPSVTYNDFNQPDGLSTSPTIRGLIGIDYLWRDWLFTVQAADRYITDREPGYVLPEHEPVFTFAVTGSSFSAQLETRFAITAIGNGDGQLWQLRNTYKPNDTWAFGLNIDVFSGDDDGFFGQFGQRDRVLLSTRYQF